MKRRIEFYQAALKPSDNPATFGLMWRVALLILVVWGFVFAYVTIGYQQLVTENATTAQQIEQNQRSLDDLGRSVAQLQKQQEDIELSLLQKNIRAREQLLTILTDRQLVSYAHTLQALAKIPWRDVALQGLSLNEDRMVLRGEAANASAVPAWILGFEQQEQLRGHEFGQLSIMQQPEGGLQFSLYSAER